MRKQTGRLCAKKGDIVSEEETLQAFHLMWDEFPGLARLIDRKHRVIAANGVAKDLGFAEGTVCAQVGDPSIHRECKLARMFAEGKAQTDNVLADRIRGWVPVKGNPDLCVHFGLMLPNPDSQ